MHAQDPNNPERKSLMQHVRAANRKSRTRRPASFYLMFAVLAVVLLGGQFVYVKDDPRRFAFFLTLNFVFFFVVMYRAVVDAAEIFRRNMRDRRDLYKDTLGDEVFVSELGRRVSENEGDAANRGT